MIDVGVFSAPATFPVGTNGFFSVDKRRAYRPPVFRLPTRANDLRGLRPEPAMVKCGLLADVVSSLVVCLRVWSLVGVVVLSVLRIPVEPERARVRPLVSPCASLLFASSRSVLPIIISWHDFQSLMFVCSVCASRWLECSNDDGLLAGGGYRDLAGVF